ncbi:ester cyclase [Rhodobacter lacus]|uniref:Ester cyclase n=1 Tax=Rhodobacter lacus TaxID=1641972 RepID=A0ABW5A6W7_9RHOB
MGKLDILRDWYDRVWIAGDLNAISDFFPRDAEADGIMPGLSLAPRDFAEFIPLMRSLVTDLRYDVLRHAETDEWLWALLRFHGTTRRSAQPIDVASHVAVRFAGGRFAEAYNMTDMITFFEQIGALPEQATALCLMGEQLR